MTSENLWQKAFLNQVSEFFQRDQQARAVFLKGSLADPSLDIDFWSDVDLVVFLSPPSAAKYYDSAEWLHEFGTVVGLERNSDENRKLYRVCFDGLRRMDLAFVNECLLPADNRPPAEGGPYVELWSRARIPATAPSKHVAVHESDEILEIAAAFWFKAATAVCKIMRQDLLIGFHLTLDLLRDCLVLQMIHRDRVLKTTIHRHGGFGNELLSRLETPAHAYDAAGIMTLLLQSCEVFDELASSLSDRYRPRLPLIASVIHRALQDLRSA